MSLLEYQESWTTCIYIRPVSLNIPQFAHRFLLMNKNGEEIEEGELDIAGVEQGEVEPQDDEGDKRGRDGKLQD